MSKYRRVRDVLRTDGFFRFEVPEFAKAEDIRRAHDADYVDRFLNGAIDRTEQRRIGFPWSEGLVRRTLASVGATMAAARDALATGLGGNLAGGTHHALRGEGAGFCVFNDIAVAILTLRAEGHIRRAAVIDLDVHQGDGTAQIFEHDVDVFTLSLHGANNFPLRKQRSRMDVALPDGTGDDEYLRALASALPRVLEFEPDIVFYQSGVDALREDTLGLLALTHEGLRERDLMVMTACRELDIPFTITLGGGYSNPIDATVQAHANTFRTAAAVFGIADSYRNTNALNSSLKVW